MMKKGIIAIMVLVGLIMPVTAVANGDDCPPEPPASKREAWFKEMRAKKHQFLIKELELTGEQQGPFFEVYDKMDEDLKAVNDQTRSMERAVFKKTDAADEEYDAVIEALYSQRYKEWTIENQAKEKFLKILDKKQMLKLKRAEFKFTRALMNQHRRQTKNNKK